MSRLSINNLEKKLAVQLVQMLMFETINAFCYL